MSDTFYVALSGMREAENRLEHAARKIARQPQMTNPAQADDPHDSVRISRAGSTPTADPTDYTADLLEALKAKNDFRANLKVAVAQDELERETLDLLD